MESLGAARIDRHDLERAIDLALLSFDARTLCARLADLESLLEERNLADWKLLLKEPDRRPLAQSPVTLGAYLASRLALLGHRLKVDPASLHALADAISAVDAVTARRWLFTISSATSRNSPSGAAHLASQARPVVALLESLGGHADLDHERRVLGSRPA